MSSNALRMKIPKLTSDGRSSPKAAVAGGKGRNLDGADSPPFAKTPSKARLPTLSLTTAGSQARLATQHVSPRGLGGRRRSSLAGRGGATPRGGAKTGRNLFSKKRPSFHLLGLIDQGNSNLTASGTSPPSTSLGTNLRSQLNRLDNTMLRTFDSKTGTIEVSHKSNVPQYSTLLRSKYLGYWRDADIVAEAEEVVRKMKVAERRSYAVQSVKRKHEEELGRILAKDVFSADIAISRCKVSLQMSLEHIVGHLDQDTRPLSIIRMQGAATDTVIYKKAEREAAAEINHFHAKVIPQGTTAVQLMSMAIDSYKERFVPAPPRQTSSGDSPIPGKPSGRVQRRPSKEPKKELSKAGSKADLTHMSGFGAPTVSLSTVVGSKTSNRSGADKAKVRSPSVVVIGIDSRGNTAQGNPGQMDGVGGGGLLKHNPQRRSSLASSCSSVGTSGDGSPLEPRVVG